MCEPAGTIVNRLTLLSRTREGGNRPRTLARLPPLSSGDLTPPWNGGVHQVEVIRLTHPLAGGVPDEVPERVGTAVPEHHHPNGRNVPWVTPFRLTDTSPRRGLIDSARGPAQRFNSLSIRSIRSLVAHSRSPSRSFSFFATHSRTFFSAATAVLCVFTPKCLATSP